MDEVPGSGATPRPVDEVNARLDRAERRLRVIEQRIDQLERAASATERELTGERPGPLQSRGSTAASSPPSGVPAWQAGGMFPVLGKALLGIAGAYLLRALSEAHLLPPGVLPCIAIVYALLWLTAGSRAKTAFSATIYACTSVLILAPLLWELTLRFKAMPVVADALTLIVFVGVAFALAHGVALNPVWRIASVSTVVLCLLLDVATHDNLPFIAAQLLTAAICEFAPGQERFARSLVALSADLGVWILDYIYRAPEITRPDYPALRAGWLIAPGCLLFSIFAAGLILKVTARRQSLSVFDVIQMTVSFLLASDGLLQFGPPAKQVIFGLLCMGLAAALYLTMFTVHLDTHRRNHVVINVWSAALLWVGVWFYAPTAARAAYLVAAATVILAVAAWRQQGVLAWHCLFFLSSGVWVSGLAEYIFRGIGTEPAGAPPWNIYLTAICASFCYRLITVRPVRKEQAFAFLFAFIAAIAVAALLAHAAVSLAAGAFQVGPHHRALIRSTILCVAALMMAFSGAHWRRPELTHIAYAVAVLEALKLVVEDLRHGHVAYVAASICLFAVTLMAIPRFAEKGRERRAA